MGQEIPSSRFGDADFAEFRHRLEMETRLLAEWFETEVFSSPSALGGFELEACLLDNVADPAPHNQRLLEDFNDPLVVPELATFNVEFNSRVHRMQGSVFSHMAEELKTRWKRVNERAAQLDLRMGMIGVLPTLKLSALTLANMSPLNRYRALNEQVFRLRNGRPVTLDIDGRESLHLSHDDVMLESAATSFQIHLQVNGAQAADLYNLSKIVSAPMVGVSANSPYLFGRDLWDETRIPLFEQAISVGASDLTKRVSFGIRYVYESIMENFTANFLRYPVLLPLLMDEPVEKLAHLRLHNGTIWRWNRPLIGFDGQGKAQLRIEHRVVPAGPSISDSIANAAFFFGLLSGLLEDEEKPAEKLSFDRARSNFYAAARRGLQAEVAWFGIEKVALERLIIEHLLPIAARGLAKLGVDPYEIEYWLGIITGRVENQMTGAAWQRAWVASHGPDFHGLMQAYLEQQERGRPVHEWPL
ncbi:MAG: glutamate--cysteine ligase [Candidatus Thiodiazotropha sp. (ex Monitilora ramsayi)]|nr:glutamate--cysteine ligase [Candidatus Thiodiazotropha sp. (ex Monitilora ramsayi)]